MKMFENEIHIIAEAGTNNNGLLSKAKNLSDIAKRAGVTSVKFQVINTWGLYLPGQYDYGKYKIEDVIKIFYEVQKEIPSKLLLVGEGPERIKAENLTKKLK
jgi:sialic acid synthase SpsE